MKRIIDKGYYLHDKNGDIHGYVTTQERIEYESDDEIVDALFCGIKEEPCETTLTMLDIDKKTSLVCDDVCELFGGPPTRMEKIKAYIRLNIIFPIKKNFKLFYFSYNDGGDWVGYHLSLYILRKKIIDKTWQHRKINSQQSS